MVAEVSRYVPGYRLKQSVQITAVADQPRTLVADQAVTHQVSVLLEVEGPATTCPPTRATSTS